MLSNISDGVFPEKSYRLLAVKISIVDVWQSFKYASPKKKCDAKNNQDRKNLSHKKFDMESKLSALFLNKLFGSAFHPFCIAIILFYRNNINYRCTNILMHTNYKLHEMKKAKTRLRRTQNLLKVTCRLK